MNDSYSTSSPTLKSHSLRKAPLFAALTCLAMQASLCFAADFRPNVTILRDDITYVVQADGAYVMDEDTEYRLNTDQAVKTRSQLPLSFSATLQDMQVIEAHTTTKEGKRIDVTQDQIRLQQSPQSQSAPMFDDGKVMTVVFPGTDVGAVLHVHLRRTQKTPLFPGQFSTVEVSQLEDEYESAQVTVKAPAAMKLFVDAIDMPGGLVSANDGGTQVWRWSIAKVSARPPEIGAVGSTDYSPRVAVTTFPSFDAAAKAYSDRAAAKSAVTPEIQQLADEITHGIPDKRAQAEALYRWVSSNIRYVAIFLDFGGVVPHAAKDIAAARYGDCKDHTTLLEALLAAKGIKSSPVLVNATKTYWNPQAAAAPGVFNHAITYVPEFHLFLDSTAALAPFGTLPIPELGKAALVIDDGSGKPALVKLPLSTPATERTTINTAITIDPDGSAHGTSTIAVNGAVELLSRQLFASLPPGIESQLASRVLSLTGQNGTGTYKHGDVHDLTVPFTYSTEFALPGLVQLPGPGALPIPQGLNGFTNIATALEGFAPQTRALAMPVVSHHIVETISVTLPKDVTVSNLPKPAHVTSPYGAYVSSYTQAGQVITVRRDLEWKFDKPLIAGDDYAALRTMAQTIMRDLRAQIIY